MNEKILTLFFLCLIALFSSFIISFFIPIETMIGDYPITIMVILFFFFGIVFFGVLSFLPHIFLGLSLGAQRNAILFLYLLPIIMATYAGVKMGVLLMEDFKQKKYFLEEAGSVVKIMVATIIIALAIEILLPMAISGQLWPEDMFGMNIEGRRNIFNVIEDLRLKVT